MGLEVNEGMQEQNHMDNSLLQKETVMIAGEKVSLITMQTELGSGLSLKVSLISKGAGIRSISLIKDGKERLLTLSYNDPSEYIKNPSLAGLTIGPNAGRLPAENGLVPNEGRNQVHGGAHNISTHYWSLKKLEQDPQGACHAIFETEQADGIDGWKGNRKYTASYSLSPGGILNISLRAETDSPTYINMTNHAYWLMEGLKLFVPADEICLNREDFLPIERVSSHPLLKDPIPLCEPLNNGYILKGEITGQKPSNNDVGLRGEAPDSGGALKDEASGSDITLRGESQALRKAALLSYEEPSVNIELFTDAPALVIYTGDYLDNEAELLNGLVSRPRIAVALEAQDMPSLMERKETTPSSPFSRLIQYRFRSSI